MIIGLTGPRCSGKTEVAKILKNLYRFDSLSFGDEVRLERDARGLSLDYDLHKLGVDLRNEFGLEYWGRRVAGRITDKIQDRVYVVEGIRTRGDVEVFKKFPDFTLVGVTAPLEVRYSRNKRNRRDDSGSYEEFVARCRRDESSSQGGLESGETYNLTNYKIDNGSSMRDLKLKVHGLVVFLRGIS